LKIAHISDVHIRNYRYHTEYKQVFEELYKKLEELQPDIIINTGDTAHTKLDVSPSYFHMAANFFEKLADIAPYHIILGNHDLNLRNISKIDAISPIVEALDHPNIFIHKTSAAIDMGNNIVFHVLSIVDPENWQFPNDSSKTNVALFHGAVPGVKTSTGYVLTHGDIEFETLAKYDYGLLGDIHKANQIIDKHGKFRYAGSLVQQNHGETDDKGFLLWDITGKNTFSVEHHIIKNPKPFVTVTLTPSGQLPDNLDIIKGTKLRLVSNNTLPLDVIRRVVDIAKTRYSPSSVTYLCRSLGSKGSTNEIIDGIIKEDLRDIAVQEELIDEYLQPYQVNSETLKKVFELNKKYNTLAEEEEEVGRNVNWSLRRLEWDNLFNYGTNNSIDFNKMSGIVGILGKNFSGKSSIIDSLLYTIYNSTSKNERKNLNIINQTQQKGRGYVEIDVGTKTYKIERISDKYEKKVKGNLTVEAKTDVDFVVHDKATKDNIVLNGLTRGETDKNIRKTFGTLDDFLFTSMTSQMGSLSFINEGSTKRKEILAKFLDLEIFDKKFKKAKDDGADIRSSLKRLKNRDFDSEIKTLREELALIETSIMAKERICKEINSNKSEHLQRTDDIEDKISSIPTDLINIKNVTRMLKEGTQLLQSLESENTTLQKELEENQTAFEKIDAFIDSFDVDSYKEKQELIDSHQKEIDDFEKELNVLKIKETNQKKKGNLLEEVPCGSEFSHCRFIKDAYKALSSIEATQVSISSLNASKRQKLANIEELEPNKVEIYLNKFTQLLEKKNSVQNNVNLMSLTIQKNKMEILRSKNKLDVLKEQKATYHKNKKVIENLESLLKEKETLNNKVTVLESQYETCKQETMELYKENGSLEQKFIQVQEEQKYKERLDEQYSAYHLFMTCMHSNGISYDIVKKRLPVINEEISKILANIVDFEIMFESDEKKLDILIKHPKYDSRPIEMGSGAEKTIAAMAIRLALLNVSTLPKGDIFVLDEPGTALDAENMEGFVRILDMIKAQFKTVLLISHLDTLKDVVDKQIIIDNVDGCAHVIE